MVILHTFLDFVCEHFVLLGCIKISQTLHVSGGHRVKLLHDAYVAYRIWTWDAFITLSDWQCSSNSKITEKENTENLAQLGTQASHRQQK